MICPFRVGVRFENLYIGNNEQDTHNRDKYLQIAQHAVYEPCEGDECPYYVYAGCQRVNED